MAVELSSKFDSKGLEDMLDILTRNVLEQRTIHPSPVDLDSNDVYLRVIPGERNTVKYEIEILSHTPTRRREISRHTISTQESKDNLLAVIHTALRHLEALYNSNSSNPNNPSLKIAEQYLGQPGVQDMLRSYAASHPLTRQVERLIYLWPTLPTVGARTT